MTDAKLVRGRWVVTGAATDDPVLSDGAVLIQDGTIAAVDAWDKLRAQHPNAALLGSDRVAVMPGMVNAHHHAYGVSTLQQGVPDDLLEAWILALIGSRPTDKHLDTLLSSARLLKTGVTAVVDVHSNRGSAEHYAATAGKALQAYDKAGIRVAFAMGVSEQSFLVHGAGEDARFLEGLPAPLRQRAESLLPGPDQLTPDDYFGIFEDLSGAHRDHGRIDLWLGPPGPQWVSDATWRRIAETAERLDTGIQTHVEESFYEKLHGPRDYGKATLFHLCDLGLLGPRFSIAHGVWLTEPEIALLAESGAAVSHNPGSNLRLRAGIAPLNALLAAGVTVGLGMDATTLGDDEDMFAEMRLAMRLSRTPQVDGPAPTPAQVFGLATAGGAKLLRCEDRLGRLAPGFAADLVLVDLQRATWPWVAPEADPRDLVLLRAQAGDVTTVLIDGEVVLEGGQPTRFDLEAAGKELADRLAGEAYPAEAARLADNLLPHLRAYYGGWDVPALEPYTRYNAKG